MGLVFILLLLLFGTTGLLCEKQEQPREENQPGAKYYNGKALVIPIEEDATVKLLQRWHDQAFSGLFSAFANQRMHKLSEKDKGTLQECSTKASEPTAQAKCVVKMLDAARKKQKSKKTKHKVHKPGKHELAKKTISSVKSKTMLKLLKHEKLRKIMEQKPVLKMISRSKAFKDQWIGGLKVARSKRAIQQRRDYSLISEDQDRTPLGVVARHLINIVRAIKNKNDTTSWSSTLVKLREKAKKMRWEKEFEKRIKKKLNLENEGDLKVAVQKRRKTPMISSKPRKAGRFTDHPEEDLLYEKIEDMENNRSENQTSTAIDDAIKFMREGIKLSLMLTGGNVTDFDKKTVKLASPRIMPVVPEEPDPDTIFVLSPSLFGLHNDGEGLEDITSITKLLKMLPNRDQEDWLNLIVEASGVSDEVKRIEMLDEEKREQATRKASINGKPLYFTRQNVSEIYGDFETRKIDVHDQLVRSFTSDQLNKMNKTGYAFMNKDQMHLLYGPTSPFNSSETLTRLLSIEGNITDKHIEKDLRLVAEMKEFNLRKKDIVLSPIISSPLSYPQPFFLQLP
ncbi:hypothetical protein QR680_015941 [Steinernema hermaphroditum]|uniref:Serpin domain-containing protein n=1 Tax=Steinernema hermaphroditum TaxID=289476 RepID=A0AA39HAI9_9BILA|nr:hypothetical protein QR680_015941 [Steinernema hermaphroditum]